MSADLLKSLLNNAEAPTRWRQEQGYWLGQITLLHGEWGDHDWLVLSGPCWEGIDQIQEATAKCGNAELPVASEVNVMGAGGAWRIAISLNMASQRVVGLLLPYIVSDGIFCTSAEFLSSARVKTHLRFTILPNSQST